MRSLLIAKREFFTAFDSPVGYVVLALFPALASALFFVLGPLFLVGETSMRDFFSWIPWLLVVLAPAIAMRIWAEERRSGTEELLLTFPFQLGHLVLGKFFGAWAILGVALLFTAGVPLTLELLGDLDWGPVLGGYVSAMLLGGASLAIGLYLSACTSNQIVAWLLGVVVLMFFNLIGGAATTSAMPPSVGRILLSLDFGEHFHSITRGVIDFGSVAFYFGVMAVFLCANGLVIERRRWS
ncbi:MAG: ABC transporter permease subunit [Planctomycetes bacterium]|nr:ABC transporter permease subunit [Planctomycetota bacterium]MCP4859986.1 ABC transporter permease subunit [Planctomycetota bacterium]